MNRTSIRNILSIAPSAVLLLLLAGNTAPQCQPETPVPAECVTPADCEGIPHADSPGQWGCVDGACVWETPQACLAQGETYDGPAEEANCCQGLSPIQMAVWEDGMCAYPNCLCYVCAACGNGVCEEGENPCNCSEDCVNTPDEGICDDGSMAICTMVPPVCPEDTIIAVQNGCFECVDPHTCMPPGQGCKEIHDGELGVCAMFLGYAWNGEGCQGISGCSCDSLCPYIFETLDACQTHCKPPADIEIIELDVQSSECQGDPYTGESPEGKVAWTWSGSTLSFQRTEVVWNCCSTVHAIATIDHTNHTITVHETEEGAMCFCECLYDLSYSISDLDPNADWEIEIAKDDTTVETEL